MEIYFNDLTDEAKEEYRKIFGPDDEHNHDMAPLCILEVLED